MNKRNYVIILISSLLAFGIEYLLFSNISSTTTYFELQLVLIWAIAQFYSYRTFGIGNIYTLVLSATFLFSVGGVFHYLISGEDICQLLGMGFGNYYFSNRIIQESLWAYSVYIWLSFITYRYLYFKFKKKNNLVSIQKIRYNNPIYYRIGKFLMYVFTIVAIYKGYLYVTSFSMDRVLIYLYGNMANPIPSWLRFLDTFFTVGYYFIIASNPDRKTFKKYSSFYFIAIIPEILLGNRGMFGAFLLFYIWYYYRNFNSRAFKVKYLLTFGIAMLMLFQLMQFYRDGFSGDTSLSITRFLVDQSVSFYILPLYIQHAGNIAYYSYPFVFYNLIGGFSGYTGQSIEVLQHNCGVGHQLMYTVSPEYYLAGASFGSSSITELYDLGALGVILGGILFSVMIFFFDKKINVSPFMRFISLFLFTAFILSSRGSFFPSLYSIIKLFIFYKFSLIVFGKIVKSNGNKYKI